MISIILKNIQRFVFLVLLQGLILNNIQLGSFINPYLYVLFILMLPIETPRWLTLIIGFILGFCVDIFTSTYGMHISASVFMAFMRPYVLTLFSPREGYEFGIRPNIQDMGFIWFVSYSSILILAHHFALFYVEVFRLNEFLSTFQRVILSFIFTLFLVMSSQFLMYKKK